MILKKRSRIFYTCLEFFNNSNHFLQTALSICVPNTIILLQAVINANIIAPLVHLLQTAEFDIKKEAAWAISNATSGGTHDQIKYVNNCFYLYLHGVLFVVSSFLKKQVFLITFATL